MTLAVELDRFAEEVKSRTGGTECYISRRSGQTVLTAAATLQNVVIRCTTGQAASRIRKKLEGDGLKVMDGEWEPPSMEPIEECPEAWIAGVAYKSSESQPGLWIEAFPNKPSTGDVLAAIHAEFTETGDLDGVPVEEFIRVAEPNVVILDPQQVDQLARRRLEGSQ